MAHADVEAVSRHSRNLEEILRQMMKPFGEFYVTKSQFDR